MAGDVQVTVNRELIEPIIKSKINAAIAEVLTGQTAFVERCVEIVLGAKVNEKLEFDSHYGKPFMEMVCSRSIRGAAQQAMEQWAKENESAIQEAVLRQLKKQTNVIVQAFLGHVSDRAKSGSCFNISVSITKQEVRY